MMLENKNPDELTAADMGAIKRQCNRVWRTVKKRWNKVRPQVGEIRCPSCSGIVSYEIEADGAITAKCSTTNCIDFQLTGRPICVC